MNTPPIPSTEIRFSTLPPMTFLAIRANLGINRSARKLARQLAVVTCVAYLTSSQSDKRTVRADRSTLWPSIFEVCYRSSSHGITPNRATSLRADSERGPRFCFLSVKRGSYPGHNQTRTRQQTDPHSSDQG